ncbi:MAG: hypothetical protein CMI01_03370 [Oceanospirillaceae bacterium]|nr:hypothetical protein [Oceanospirillaceae bacterium]
MRPKSNTKRFGQVMSTKSLVFFFLAVMTPVIGQAQVQIKLDPTIKVHVVNEAPAEQYLSAQEARLELPNGEHQLVIEKVVRLRDAADESFLDSSDALILLFNASDEQLTLETPAVDTRYELKTFNRKPKAYLLDANGNKKDLKIDTLIKEGFQLDRNYIAEIQSYGDFWCMEAG